MRKIKRKTLSILFLLGASGVLWAFLFILEKGKEKTAALQNASWSLFGVDYVNADVPPPVVESAECSSEGCESSSGEGCECCCV